MSGIASALYSGIVTHRRLRPRAHFLRYRVFMLLLDLDEVEARLPRLRLLRAGRRGLMSFDPRDHGDGSTVPLRQQIAARLAEAGLPADGAVRLLCMPRVLGHGFNPLSVYFCYRACGALGAILYEVSNTFGERHSYLIRAPATGEVRQGAPKRFHVSPFLDMDLVYDFRVTPPGEEVAVCISVLGAEGPMLSAAFTGRRSRLDDQGLLLAWLKHPLLTLKVVAAIHLEALRLWRKGIAYRPRPPAPVAPVTIGTMKEKPKCAG